MNITTNKLKLPSTIIVDVFMLIRSSHYFKNLQEVKYIFKKMKLNDIFLQQTSFSLLNI